MVITDYKMWESKNEIRLGVDGIYRKENKDYVVGLPSGEVIDIDDPDDMNFLIFNRLVQYKINLGDIKLNCYTADDKDISKIKYLLDEKNNKRNNEKKYIERAKELREEVRKETNKKYVVTYSKPNSLHVDEYSIIIPDLYDKSYNQMALNNICTNLMNKYPRTYFGYVTRNAKLIGVEYLRIED